MRWLSYVPGKSTLILLFTAAKQRVMGQSNDIAELPNARIISATEELNQIADDVGEAQAMPGASASAGSARGLDAEKRREPQGRRHGDR